MLDDPLDGVTKCNHFVGTSYCAVTCRGDKVVFNATGNWGARTWYCLAGNPVWMPTPKVPDCVGKFKNCLSSMIKELAHFN